ncbi:effector-associated domain EAD1-containing protein [Catellatospora coxensis]
MAEAEMSQPGRRADSSSVSSTPLPNDVRLSDDEHDALIREMVFCFTSNDAARSVLRQMRVPASLFPAWTDNAITWWQLVDEDLERGTIPEPYRRMISVAHERFPGNRVLHQLWRDHVEGQPTQHPLPQRSDGCHVIFQASTGEEREQAAAALRAGGLQPTEVWTSQHAVSFAVDQREPNRVSRILDQTGLVWTVVAPGQPDYLLRELFVQAPDGTRYLINDAPAQQTVGAMASDVARQLQRPSTAAPGQGGSLVVDRMTPGGGRERLSGDATLHDAGVVDGDQLGVGLEGRAGAVNPVDRQVALDRAYKQVLAFAAGVPGEWTSW